MEFFEEKKEKKKATSPRRCSVAEIRYSSAATEAAKVLTVDTVMFEVGGCQPSSIGRRSFSNIYVIRETFPLPSVASPNTERMRPYSSSVRLLAKVALKFGLLAAPYTNRALRSAAATAN